MVSRFIYIMRSTSCDLSWWRKLDRSVSKVVFLPQEVCQNRFLFMGGGSSKNRWPVSDVVTFTERPWQRWYKDLNITQGCILHVQGMSIGCFKSYVTWCLSASNRNNKAIGINIQASHIRGPECSWNVCGDVLFIRLWVQLGMLTFLLWCMGNKAVTCI